ncbi:MAG: hypothetical protein AAF747_00685 [Planctomycetota bacterium]
MSDEAMAVRAEHEPDEDVTEATDAEVKSADVGDEQTDDAPADELSDVEAAWAAQVREAESAVGELRTRLDAAGQAADDLRRSLDESKRARAIDLALARAGATDVAAARELIGSDDSDVLAAVEQLRERRPGLFARAPGLRVTGGQMPRSSTKRAAHAARETGDRRLLLRYLRLRRGGE